MMGVLTTQIIDVQRHARMIDQTMEKLREQINIELTDHRPRKIAMHLQARTSGEINHHPRQRLVKRHIAMSVASQPLLVAPGLGQGLAERDADIFHRMMGIDVQIAFGVDIQINQTMTRDLIKHVIKKGNTGGKSALTSAVKIQTHSDLRLQGITGNFDLPHAK